MSTPVAQCPHCFARIPAGTGGAVVCPSCEHEFPATTGETPKKPAGPPVARAVRAGGKAAPSEKATAAPVPTAKPARDRDRDRDEDDARPQSRSRGSTAASRRPAEDDDDRPRSRRRRYEEDDEPKKKNGSALPLMMIGGGALLLLTLAGAAAVAVAVFGSQPVAQGTMLTTTPAPSSEVKGGNPPPPRGNWNDPDPFLEPNNEGPRGPGDFQPPLGPGGFDPPIRPGDPVKPKAPKAPPKYAAVTPLEIKPAKLADDKTEVKLPGKVDDACSGGGGRFYILHISGKRQLAVFDVNEAKVVKYIGLASDTVKFAAGMNKLVVYYPDQSTFARYDLTTFEKEATVKNPLGGDVRFLCMGSASAGPLMVYDGKTHFLDPATLAEVEVADGGGRGGHVGDNMHYRASPDGTVFAGWCTSHSPQGLNSLVVTGGQSKGYYEHNSVGHLVPGPDNQLYTGGGLYTSQLKKLGRADRVSSPLLPAAEGAMYLRLTSGNDPAAFPGGMPGDGQKMKLEVRMSGDERTVHAFKDVSLVGNEAWTASDFTNDKRVHFAPTAHLLAVIPPTNDAVVVHKFDLEAAFEASGVDYLYVTSRPTTAVPGKAYSYQILTKSKRGGVTYKLEAGPKGMAVSPGGLLTWPAPHDFTAAEPVLVTVADASGQEIFHSFDLAPGDGKTALAPGGTAGTAKAAGGGDKPDAKAGGPLVLAPDRVFEVKPPALQEKASVQLPAAADAVCVGGGGRFLIFRLGEKKQLAVLDVTAGRVVKYLPIAEADALVAAGMTKLFVLNKAANALLRYDLEKFEKEVTAQNPLGGSPSIMLMGHSSDGPLYVGGPDVGTDTKGYGFINPRTMKELKVPLDGDGRNGQPVAGPGFGGDRFGGARATGVAIAPDGRTLTWADDWGGNKVMTLGEKSAKVKGDGIGGGQNRGALVPGPDGHLFGGHGFYTADLKRVGEDKRLNTHGTHVPATSGPWYVGAVEAERWNNPTAKRRVFVGMTTDDRTKLTLDAVDGLPAGDYQPWDAQQAKKLPLAARLHLVPEAEVLAVLDDGMEKVHLHRVSMKAVLEKADGDRLLVVSRPRPAVRGAKWAYTPEVWSKKGGVKVKVESGPDGMKADGGAVTWDVPAKFAEDEPSVILTVSDASGQETFHTFALSVRSDPLPAASVIKPTVAPSEAVKPPDPAKLPGASAFPLKPTAAKDGTDVDLSAAADYACLAGGGRFLLFRIPSKKEVAVFDTVEGKVVKQLPMPEDGALVAGGRGHAFVVSPKAGVVQRWNLTTFEKEATTKLPDGFAPTAAVMGHASDGPLVMGALDQFGGGGRNAAANGYYDPFTLKKLDLTSPNNDYVPDSYDPDTIHATPDGRVFAWFRRHVSPSGMSCAVLDGKSAKRHYSHTTADALMVGADGTLFCGGGVFSTDLRTVIDAHTPEVKSHNGHITGGPGAGYFPVAGRTPIPAADGPFYLWFPAGKPGEPPPGVPSLKMLGVKGALAEMKGLRGLDEPKEGSGAPRPRPRPGTPADEKVGLPHYQRTFLIPAVELLAVLSPDGTKVHIHAFKARELMDKSGTDYLVLLGRPPQFAARGQKWAYTPDVWSKKGGVKVEVASGPPGMKAEGAGVSWAVPADLIDNRVTVELKIADASGQALTLKFPLSLDGTAAGPPTLTTAGVTTGTGKPADPKAKFDDALLGTWEVTKQEVGGAVRPAKSIKFRYTFEKDGTIRLTGGPEGIEQKYAVDTASTPKAIDITLAFPGQIDTRTQYGVYEVTGDTLRLCTPITPGGERPAAVKSEAQTNVLTLERVKDGAKPPVKADPPKDLKKEGPKADDPKGGGKKIVKGQLDDALVGTWRVEREESIHAGGMVDDQKIPATPDTRFTFSKDGTGTPLGKKQDSYITECTFTTDPTASPKAIDFYSKPGSPEDCELGIYEVNGDVLRICRPYSFGIGPRPTAFKAKAGECRVLTLRRVKEGEPKTPAAPPPDTKKIEKGKLDDDLVGTWSSDMVIEHGSEGNYSAVGLKDIKVVIRGDGTCKVGQLPGIVGTTDATFTSNPTASPKALDLALTHGTETETRLTVYEVNGHTLKICYGLDPKAPRPTALKGEIRKTVVAVFRRVKDEPVKEPPVKSTDPLKKDDKGKFDDALVGSWLVTKLELNGGELPSNVSKQTYTFGKDGTGRLTGGPEDCTVKYTVDAAATPKTIDLTISATGLPDSDQRGVYEVTGDTLRLCTALVKGAERPRAMKSGDKVLLLTLTRVKDGAKPPVKADPPKEAKPADPGKKAGKAKPDDALTGTWVVDKAEVNGKELPLPPPVAAMRHIFDKDGGVRVTGGPNGDEMVGTYTADTSGSPKVIDLTLKSKRGAEVTNHGVYEVEDETLRLAMPAVPGGARPADLKGTPQSPVLVLRRLAEKKEAPKK